MSKLDLKAVAENHPSAVLDPFNPRPKPKIPSRLPEPDMAVENKLRSVFEIANLIQFKKRASGWPEEREYHLLYLPRRKYSAARALYVADLHHVEEDDHEELEKVAPDWLEIAGILWEGESLVWDGVALQDTVIIHNLHGGVSLVVRTQGDGYTVTKHRGATQSVRECADLKTVEQELHRYSDR